MACKKGANVKYTVFGDLRQKIIQFSAEKNTFFLANKCHDPVFKHMYVLSVFRLKTFSRQILRQNIFKSKHWSRGPRIIRYLDIVQVFWGQGCGDDRRSLVLIELNPVHMYMFGRPQ
jgi:hypothetical protein